MEEKALAEDPNDAINRMAEMALAFIFIVLAHSLNECGLGCVRARRKKMARDLSSRTHHTC